MSKKATMGSRTVSKALSESNRAVEDARLSSQAAKLAKDAVNAAIAASCAAERANATQDGRSVKDTTSVKKVAKDVRTAAEEAVEWAKDAMRAESEGDAVGAAHFANLSARAAQRAASLSSAASVLVGRAKAMASDKALDEPTVTVPSTNRKTKELARLSQELSGEVDRSARYLVTYDRRIIATFLREEDAFLLEAELADLDRERAAKTGTCLVLDRKTGNHLGGYMMSNGKMLVFVRDDKYDARYGKSRR